MCLHRHKKHHKLFGQQGLNEVKLLWEWQLLSLCQPTNKLGKALFSMKPHITWDKLFSGDENHEICGFGIMMTCRRDWLSSEVPKKYFCHGKMQVTPRTRVACFQRPIAAIKKHSQNYKQFVNCQSTSSCNIVSVNALTHGVFMPMQSREVMILRNNFRWLKWMSQETLS